MTNPTTPSINPIDIDWLDETIARNRALYAGWTMELEEDTPSDEQPAAEDEDQASSDDTEEEPAEEQAEDPEDDAEEPADEDVDDESTLDLTGAKKALSKVRKSEAAMRTRLRDIEAKLADAKTPEQVEELLASVRTENAQESKALLVENVALKFKLPDDLAEALKGETREELEAHAKVLAKYAPSVDDSDDPDLSGGLDPSGDSGNFDPVKAAREARRTRY